MGGNLGTHRKIDSAELPELNDAGNWRASIVELLKPECLKIENGRKKKQQLHLQERDITKAGKPTLEECLLSSPCLNQGSKPTSCTWISVSSYSRLTSMSCDDFFLDGEMKLGEEIQESLASSSAESQCVNKKRVRFRLPEEADIHIFYSPGYDQECEER